MSKEMGKVIAEGIRREIAEREAALATPPGLPPYRWQIKVLGYFWRFDIAEWIEWHRPESDQRTRRAWWWLWSFRWNGRSCFRVCGLTLHSKSTPWTDFSRYYA